MKLKPGTEADYAAYKSKNDDPYGACVVQFSETWGDLMEKELAAGKKVSDVAESTWREADKSYGITGFMYGCAVKGLSHFWCHGEELRQWHNLDCQIGTEGEKANREGGVLNPALLIIKCSGAS